VDVHRGDVTDVGVLDAVLPGHDAVLSALGLRRAGRSPWAPLRSPADLTERTMRQLLPAMQRHGVPRLLAISAAGVGDSHGRLTWPVRRLVASGNVAVAYRDLAAMEALLAASDRDWLAVRPVTLTDGAAQEARAGRRAVWSHVHHPPRGGGDLDAGCRGAARPVRDTAGHVGHLSHARCRRTRRCSRRSGPRGGSVDDFMLATSLLNRAVIRTLPATMRRPAAALLTVIAAAACRPTLAPAPALSGVAADVAHLASAALEGRAPGTAGNDSAAAYIARRYRELGFRGAFGARAARRQTARPPTSRHSSRRTRAGTTSPPSCRAPIRRAETSTS
jgi:hypothetical protein